MATVDLAVHSAKDMVTRAARRPGAGAGCLPREDVRDVLVSRCRGVVCSHAEGAVVGTASLRRQAQVLRLRPDLKVVADARQCRNAA